MLFLELIFLHIGVYTVKKLLQDPVFIDDYGPKGDYELLREKNIRELERLKKESGLFN